MAPKVMSLDRPRINTANTGKAPAIRRMKLRYPELSQAQIAKRVGCDPANVHRVLERFLGENLTQQDIDRYKDERADVFRALQIRMLGSITDAEIAKTPLGTRVISTGILYDKERLETGQATAINVSVLMDVVEAIRSRPRTTAQIEAELPPAE